VPATATVNQGDCRPEDDGDEDDPAGHGHRSAEHRRLDEDRPAQLAAVGSDAAQECEGAGALGDEDLERVGDDECRDDECDGSEAQHDRGEHLGPAAELGDLRIRAVRVVDKTLTVVRVSVGPAVRVGSGLVTRTDCGVTRRSPTDTASRCATAAGNAIWPGAVGSAPVLRTCASRRVSVVVEGLRCDEVGRTARSHQPTPMRVGTRAPRRRAPGG
jgi:hypothetical protein